MNVTTTSEVYKLDMDSELNQPFYYYTFGGRGMHEGLSETDRYVILTRVANQYVFLNLNTGTAVKGLQSLSRFKLAV